MVACARGVSRACEVPPWWHMVEGWQEDMVCFITRYGSGRVRIYDVWYHRSHDLFFTWPKTFCRTWKLFQSGVQLVLLVILLLVGLLSSFGAIFSVSRGYLCVSYFWVPLVGVLVAEISPVVCQDFLVSTVFGRLILKTVQNLLNEADSLSSINGLIEWINRLEIKQAADMNDQFGNWKMNCSLPSNCVLYEELYIFPVICFLRLLCFKFKSTYTNSGYVFSGK